MCALSVIYDYGNQIKNCNQEKLNEFLKLVNAAKQFDQVTKQPDCEDPEKQKWLTNIIEETQNN